MNDAEVYFRLVGDNFDPTEVVLGIQPTRIQRKGTPIPKLSSWVYSTGKIINESIDVYEMSSGLVSQLEPYTDAIIAAMKTHSLEAVFQVVLTITLDESKSTPAVGFDQRTISFLDRVGASIDIDTYRGEI